MARTLFRRRRHQDGAYALYNGLVAQARLPYFYLRLGVPDTVDGRFDLIALHAFLVMHRLKSERNPVAAELGQELFDLMFADMDRNLREMGVGDLSVGARVKTMVSAFYGRIQAYEAGLAAAEPGALADAVRRNVFRGADSGDAGAIAAYMRAEVDALASQPVEALMSGQLQFTELPPV